MVSKETAAKLFVVGWVKNWSMWTYIGTVTEKSFYIGMPQEEIQAAFEAAARAFPWLSSWHVPHSTVRTFAGSYHSRLNDLLWDQHNAKWIDAAMVIVLAKRVIASKFLKKYRRPTNHRDVQELRANMENYVGAAAGRELLLQSGVRKPAQAWHQCK
jgi:hypothetical protein